VKVKSQILEIAEDVKTFDWFERICCSLPIINFPIFVHRRRNVQFIYLLWWQCQAWVPVQSVSVQTKQLFYDFLT